MGTMPIKKQTTLAWPEKKIDGKTATFEGRKLLAQPGNVFLSENKEHAVLVLGVNDEDGKQALAVVRITCDGSPQPWIVESLANLELPDSWTLHGVEHVKLEYFPQEKA